jgi:hypothetical protein
MFIVIPANASDPASYLERSKLDPDFRRGDDWKIRRNDGVHPPG